MKMHSGAGLGIMFDMSSTLKSLRLPPLGKRQMAQLVESAKQIGVQPEDYAKQLVEDGLALQREAELMSFPQIVGRVRRANGVVDESEVVQLVEAARTDLYRNKSRRKKS